MISHRARREKAKELLKFYKMSGAGNDFIIIDHRQGGIGQEQMRRFVAGVCRRKLSVGADGVIFIEESRNADFKWRFFNADGSDAEMCGNGARCVARYAFLNHIAGPEMAFETLAGTVHAHVKGDRVRIKMTDPTDMQTSYPLTVQQGPLTVSSVNTGVPHVVVPVVDIEKIDIDSLGREIRFHERYAPAGTNVNFIPAGKEMPLALRTYERGVEGETLACGTGAVAVALVSAAVDGQRSPVELMTRSKGRLSVSFQEEAGRYSDIFLEGDARMIYQGELCDEAWMDPKGE